GHEAGETEVAGRLDVDLVERGSEIVRAVARTGFAERLAERHRALAAGTKRLDGVAQLLDLSEPGSAGADVSDQRDHVVVLRRSRARGRAATRAAGRRGARAPGAAAPGGGRRGGGGERPRPAAGRRRSRRGAAPPRPPARAAGSRPPRPPVQRPLRRWWRGSV